MSNKKTIDAEATEVTEIVERPYSLRKFKDGDLIPLLKLLREIGLKEFKEPFSQVTTEGSIKKIGAEVMIDLIDKMIENICGPAGEDIYAFYAELSGMDVAEIKEMEFGTLPLMIYDSFSEAKNTSFFKVLFKLL